MSDNGTTSIDSLPQTPENIRLETTERYPTNMKIDNSVQQLKNTLEEDPAMLQKNLNQFVTGIQQASAAGMTGLPSRDIPQSQTHLTQDMQIQPNFVPTGGPQDYIYDHQTSEEIVQKNAQRQAKTDSLDELYNELQTPLLIAVLYFLFQLPVVRKNIFNFAPMLFQKDGNPNLSGYVINSCLFASLYYALTKSLRHFSI